MNGSRWFWLVFSLLVVCVLRSPVQAQLNVITVDCTPFVSPSPNTSFGPDNTMGMALRQVDTGGLFNVTEVTPAAFRAMTPTQLGAFDLIAINNHPDRIDCGSGLGLGGTWHSVVGVSCGSRVLLTSHDAPRFHILVPPGGGHFEQGMPGPGVEPYGADKFVRQAALWAGGGLGTGLLVFNDSAGFVGGSGWNNPELHLPPAWGITDLSQGGGITDGGYTDVLPGFATHPVYAGLGDARFGVNSISSFAANAGDGSFDSIFGSFNGAIFTATEVVVNAGVQDVGGRCPVLCSAAPAAGPNGTAITLIRDCQPVLVTMLSDWGRRVTLAMLMIAGGMVLVRRQRRRSLSTA